jgi:hypothetical protein
MATIKDHAERRMIRCSNQIASRGESGALNLVCGWLVDIVDHDEFERLFLRHELETQRFNTKKKGRGLVNVTTLHRTGRGHHREIEAAVQASFVNDLSVLDKAHQHFGEYVRNSQDHAELGLETCLGLSSTDLR